MTPLHAVWAGQEAVFLFFVLSGLVLTLAVIQQPQFDWASYYPRRLVRLYLPVWAAVTASALAMAIVPRAPEQQESRWLGRRAASYDSESLRIDLTLIWGPDNFTLSPLWSLRWEVFFSILLPIFVIFAVRAKQYWPVKILALGIVLAIGAHTGWTEFRYLPMFAIGSLIAVHWEEISVAMTRRLRSNSIGWWALLIAVILFTSRWWLLALGTSPALDRWMSNVALVGATALVLLAAFWPVARRALEWWPIRWVGLISFSLYLIHEPIILGVRYLLIEQSMFVVAIIAFPLALIGGWVFFLLVERPANWLARRSGNAASSARSRASTPPE